MHIYRTVQLEINISLMRTIKMRLKMRTIGIKDKEILTAAGSEGIYS